MKRERDVYIYIQGNISLGIDRCFFLGKPILYFFGKGLWIVVKEYIYIYDSGCKETYHVKYIPNQAMER